MIQVKTMQIDGTYFQWKNIPFLEERKTNFRIVQSKNITGLTQRITYVIITPENQKKLLNYGLIKFRNFYINLSLIATVDTTIKVDGIEVLFTFGCGGFIKKTVTLSYWDSWKTNYL